MPPRRTPSNQPEYNFAAAFLHFSRGTPLAEIAGLTGIPEEVILRKSLQEHWKVLALEVSKASMTVVKADAGDDAAVRVKQNREKNLKVVAELQEDLANIVEQLRTGVLKIERQTAKGQRWTSGPTIKDRVDLVAYAKGVQELSYRALGDVVTGSDAGPSSANGTITIVLPSVVAAPRQARDAQPEDNNIIDVTPSWPQKQIDDADSPDTTGSPATTSAKPSSTTDDAVPAVIMPFDSSTMTSSASDAPTSKPVTLEEGATSRPAEDDVPS